LFCLHIVERVVFEFTPVRNLIYQPVPRVAVGFAVAAALLIVLIETGNTTAEFIYFRF